MFTILAQSMMTAARQDDTTIPRWNAPRHLRKPPQHPPQDRRAGHD